MKLLLDESAPRRLGTCFPDSFEVRTVPQMGWAGSTNGDLLRLAAANGFDALITVDRGFEHQQNVSQLPLPVVIVIAARNRMEDLQPLVPAIVAALMENLQRRIYRVPS